MSADFGHKHVLMSAHEHREQSVCFGLKRLTSNTGRLCAGLSRSGTATTTSFRALLSHQREIDLNSGTSIQYIPLDRTYGVVAE